MPQKMAFLKEETLDEEEYSFMSFLRGRYPGHLNKFKKNWIPS
jgi:hypothetical protein